MALLAVFVVFSLSGCYSLQSCGPIRHIYIYIYICTYTYTYKAILRVIRRLWGGWGVQRFATSIHKSIARRILSVITSISHRSQHYQINITPISHRYLISIASNYYRNYHTYLSHQAISQMFRSISHRFHVSSTSISHQFHNVISSVLHWYHTSITPISRQYHINIYLTCATSSHRYHNRITSVSQQHHMFVASNNVSTIHSSSISISHQYHTSFTTM